MTVRTTAGRAGLAAGALWLLAGLLGWGDDPVTGFADLLWKVGLVALCVAGGAGGYALVETGPRWLRVTVSVCAAALAVVLADLAAPGFDAGSVFLGLVGLALAGGSAAGLRSQRAGADNEGKATGQTT